MNSFAEQNPHSCQYCRDFSFDFRKTGNDAHKETQIQRFKSITWLDNERKTYDWDEAQSYFLRNAEKRTSISELLDQEKIFIFEQTSKTVEEKVDEGCCLFTFLLAVEENRLKYPGTLKPKGVIIAAKMGLEWVKFGICSLRITDDGEPRRLKINVWDGLLAGVGTNYGVYLFCYFSLLNNCHTYLCNVYRSTIVKGNHPESDES
jgi:hypothetical protein